jgi:hypothetical protein
MRRLSRARSAYQEDVAFRFDSFFFRSSIFFALLGCSLPKFDIASWRFVFTTCYANVFSSYDICAWLPLILSQLMYVERALICRKGSTFCDFNSNKRVFVFCKLPFFATACEWQHKWQHKPA